MEDPRSSHIDSAPPAPPYLSAPLDIPASSVQAPSDPSLNHALVVAGAVAAADEHRSAGRHWWRLMVHCGSAASASILNGGLRPASFEHHCGGPIDAATSPVESMCESSS
jgi:hypothetical protein